MPHGEQIVDGLAKAIARTRDMANSEATDMAEQIAIRDSKNQILIGLQANGEHAVYFQFSLGAIEAVPFDEFGIDGITANTIEREDSYGKVDDWLAQRDASVWAWLHPRWRWVYTENLNPVAK